MRKVNFEYEKRINRVIDYLRSNLDKSYNLEELAKVACFSEFHFHRIFGIIAGETLNSFTNRLRLEKSARLLRDTKESLTEVALECGFSSSSTFSRSFSKAYATTPKEYRKTGKVKNSKICKELFPEHEYILPMTDAEKRVTFPVEVKKFPNWDVGYIRVTNAFEGDTVRQTFATVTEWAKSKDIYESGTLFGMSIDDPEVTPKHLYRYEVCFTSEEPFECTENISKMTIPSRSYAVTRVSGDIKLVATAWDYLFRNWLVNSDYEPEHAPAFEIFLNKEKATDWSSFELDLCLPIKKMNK